VVVSTGAEAGETEVSVATDCVASVGVAILVASADTASALGVIVCASSCLLLKIPTFIPPRNF
jgi:hypothetical protein